MRIIIQHPDGQHYSVTPEVYRRKYEDLGFVAIRYEDGRPFEPEPGVTSETNHGNGESDSTDGRTDDESDGDDHDTDGQLHTEQHGESGLR